MTDNINVFLRRMDGCEDKMEIVDLITKEDATIIDFGAGGGIISIKLAQKLPNATIYAIERDFDMRILLKKRLKELNIQNVRVFSNLFKFIHNVDYVICSAVLHEELEDKEVSRLDSLLSDYLQFHSVLKEDGKLIIREAIKEDAYNDKTFIAKLEPKNERDLLLIEDYLKRHTYKSYTKGYTYRVHELSKVIFGNYYLLYGAMFAVVFGEDSYIQREKNEFRFLGEEELPPKDLFELESQKLYSKEDIIEHLEEKFILTHSNDQLSNYAATNGLMIYKKLSCSR